MKLPALLLTLGILAGCSGAGELPAATVDSPEPPLAESTPSPSPLPSWPMPGEYAECAGDASTIAVAARKCLTAHQTKAVLMTTLKYHFGPGINIRTQQKFQEYGEWALPYLSGFLSVLTAPTTIQIFVVTDSTWCGEQLEPFYYGTAKELSKSYLCGVGTGANAGHTKLPRTAFVSHRPTPVSSAESFATLVAEMGHASRSLMMEEFTGEVGGQPYWPIWAQYLVNETLWKLALQREGFSEKDARADRVWWGCRPDKTSWLPDYGDSRLQSWDIPKSGIYGCPPSEEPNVESPSHYNMAYMAAEYFTATRGFGWIQDVFMPTLVRLRGDKDAAANEFGWVSWRALEIELNENMYDVIRSYGVKLPKQ